MFEWMERCADGLFGHFGLVGFPLVVEVPHQDPCHVVGGNVPMQGTSVCDGDFSGLFGYDQTDGIRNLAHDDRGTVSCSVGFRHFALGYRQDALGGNNTISFDDNGPVVQRAVLEEEVFEQRG